MSELDDFLSWGAHAGDKGERDQFGKPLKDARFPYGQIAWWIGEYKRAKSGQR